MLLLKATTETLQVTNTVPSLVPTLKGYVCINKAPTGFTISPDGTILPGDWMIMVVETFSTITWTDPIGWTVLQAQTQSTGGTLVTKVYGKIRVAGETAYVISMPSGANASLVALMWGSGGAPIASWVVGATMTRSAITPTTSVNNLAPSITTTTNNNLVLAISSTRFSGTVETALAGYSGATQWFFVGEPNATSIETLSVGYIQQATAGATSNVTATYFNSQAYNGLALQIGIPPSTGNLDYSVSYSDDTPTTSAMSSNEGKITFSTTATILSAPASATERLARLITISNTDPFLSNTVTIQKNIGGTVYTIAPVIVLLPGETTQYVDKTGWTYYSASGAVKANQALVGSSNNQININGFNNSSTNAIAYSWQQTRSGAQAWNYLTMSGDGTHLAAVVNNSYIYTSVDFGTTWVQQTSGLATQDWTGIASSIDGTYLAAVNFGNTIYTSSNAGATWTSQTASGSRNWLAITSSSDGTKLAATVQNGNIYTSTNSGVSWTVQAGSPSINWYGLASSSDGTKLVGVGLANYIFTSADSGVTWVQQATSQNWYAVASSSDGTHLAAVVNPGYIYTSADSGVTWVQQTGSGSQAWTSIASSGDGTRLSAIYGTFIYTSTNTGVTWTQQTGLASYGWGNIVSSIDGTKLATVVSGGYVFTASLLPISNPTWTTTSNGIAQQTQSNYNYTLTQTSAPSLIWKALTSSSDGTQLAAANTSNGYIYTSTNSGVAWTQQTGSGSRTWSAMASSSDGTKLYATEASGYIYTSTNSGVAWTQQTGSGSLSWVAIVSSNDGTKLAAVVSSGYVYTSTNLGVTWTQQTGSGSLSWTALASSNDGTKLAATVSGGYIYTSPDSGVTWTQQTGSTSQTWKAITSSADGTKLAAANTSNGYIYTSPDSGVTWTQQTGSTSQTWKAITSSADGTKLAAANTSNGYIYTSIDSGVTWLQTAAPSQVWSALVSSSDGTRIIAANTSNGYIYTQVATLAYTPAQALLTNEVKPVLTNGVMNNLTQQTGSGARNWVSIAASYDGTKLVAASNTASGTIYTSTDSGVTWTLQSSAPTQSYFSVASSTDGTKLAAAVNGGYIYTSTNSGVTWIQQTGSGSLSWQQIVSSSDGTKLAAAVNGGYIYTSTNAGLTWTQQTGSGSLNWQRLAMSSDGTKIFGAVNTGYIYSSSNSGVTWTQQTSAGSQSWTALAVSADGTKVAAAVTGGYIYTSTNSGVSWTQQSTAGAQSWICIAYSPDGSRIAAGVSGGYIYLSNSGGLTWTLQPTSATWEFIVFSSDNTKLAAVSYGSYIYTLVLPPFESNTLALPSGNSTLALNAWTTDPLQSVPTLSPAIASLGAMGYKNAAANLVVPVPSGVVSGSLVVMFVFPGANNAMTFPAMMPATSAWSYGGGQLPSINAGSYYLSSAWYYHYATGPESGNYTMIMGVDNSGGSVLNVNAYAMRITGGPTSGNPFVDTFQSGSVVGGTTATVSTFTPGAASSLLLAGIFEDSNGSLTIPSSLQLIAGTVNPTGNASLGIAYQAQSTATATGSLTITAGSSTNLGMLVATIRPTGPPVVAATGTVGVFASSTSLPIGVPSGVVAGSLVVVFFYGYWTNVPVFPTILTPPSGFILAGSVVTPDTVYNGYNAVAWYYKYATASDTGTYAFTLGADSSSGAVEQAYGYAHLITNGPTSGNPFVDPFQSYGSPVNIAGYSVPSFTPGGNNSLLLAGMAMDDDRGGATLTYPSGWTIAAQHDDTGLGIVIGSGYVTQTTTAYTGLLTYTTSKTSPGAVFIGTIRASSAITTPSTNIAATYARNVASNMAVAVLDQALTPMNLQSALWQKTIMTWLPGTTNVGVWTGVNGVTIGTAAAVSPTTTNVYTSMRRSTFSSVVTTTNQQVGIRSEIQFLLGATKGQGGFFFSCRFGFDVIATGERAFVGFAPSTAIVSADPSTFTNILGFGFDLADNGFSFYHNGNSGTATKEPIPGQGILATSNKGYDAYIWMPPNSATVYYRLDRTDTGATLVNSSVSTNLPLNTTTLLATAQMSNGTANTAVNAAVLGINRLYVETLR